MAALAAMLVRSCAQALVCLLLFGALPLSPRLSDGVVALLQGKTIKAVTLLSLKRTHDLFVGNQGQKAPLDEEAQKAKIACKVRTIAGASSNGCIRIRRHVSLCTCRRPL